MTCRVLAFVVSSTIVCASCATKLETLPLAGPKLTSATPGVVVYPPRLVKVTYAFSTLVDAGGNVLGTAPDKCVPSTKDELQYMPDLDHPMALVHKPSAWAATKFSVTLKDGMLTSINTESEAPAKAIAGAVTALLTAATPILQARSAIPEPTGKPLCNAAPTIIKLSEAKVDPAPEAR